VKIMPLKIALLSAAALTLAVQAHAGGFYLQEQSARGAGRAYSGEVADQGVESLWWNPAAIASSPREVYVGAHGILVDGEADDRGSTITYPGGITVPVGGEARAFKPIRTGIAPNFAIATPIGDRFAVGFSVAAPFDFTAEYRPRAWARYDALSSKLKTADLQLTGAMKATDWLDLGVAANAEYTKATLSSAYPNLSPLLPDGVSQLSGDGWNWGWSVGAQARLGTVTLGASYRSAMDHDLDGRVVQSGLLGPLSVANLDAAGKASLTTPWIAVLGARWRINDRLTLDGQVQRFGWSQFKEIQVSLPGGGGETLAQNYKDTSSGAVGLDYAVTDRLTLRTGIQFDQTPTPEASRTARVPDGDRWLYSIGATARLAPSLQLDAALIHVEFEDSRVSHDTVFNAGTPAQTTAQLRGQVQGTGEIFSLGLRKTF
jgi:long-chain fatty acid transport protein